MAISITIGEITVSHPVKWPSTLAPVTPAARPMPPPRMVGRQADYPIPEVSIG